MTAVEQDIIQQAADIGYVLMGNYPVEPYYLRGQCKMGFTLADREDALKWIEEEKAHQALSVRRFLQQNAEDDAE